MTAVTALDFERITWIWGPRDAERTFLCLHGALMAGRAVRESVTVAVRAEWMRLARTFVESAGADFRGDRGMATANRRLARSRGS